MLFLTIVLRITSSLRMQAVMMTLGFLPRAFKRSEKALMTGLERRARASPCTGYRAPNFGRRGSAPSSELAAVAIEGGQADQCGDFSSTQLPQLGDLGDQGCTRARSNPRCALNNLGLLFPLVVRLDQRGDSLLEASDSAWRAR